MFSLPEFTKVKVLDVVVLSKKNRAPDANSGVRLNVQANLPNHVLMEFDGGSAIRAALFTKSAASETAKDKRQTLPGIEAISDLPNLSAAGRHVPKLPWSEKLTGYTVTIDHGMGGQSNLVIGDATLEKFRFAMKEGGTVTAWWSIEVVDVPKPIFAELGDLKSREVPMTFREPEVTQQDIEDEQPPAPAAKGRKGKKADAAGAWPFPGDGPKEGAAPQTPEEAFVGTAGTES